MVSRIYVEKKPGFDVEAQQLTHELRTILGIGNLNRVRVINRYDVEGISDELFDQCVPTVFSEPQVDVATPHLPYVIGGEDGLVSEASEATDKPRWYSRWNIFRVSSTNVLIRPANAFSLSVRASVPKCAAQRSTLCMGR